MARDRPGGLAQDGACKRVPRNSTITSTENATLPASYPPVPARVRLTDIVIMADCHPALLPLLLSSFCNESPVRRPPRPLISICRTRHWYYITALVFEPPPQDLRRSIVPGQKT